MWLHQFKQFPPNLQRFSVQPNSFPHCLDRRERVTPSCDSMQKLLRKWMRATYNSRLTCLAAKQPPWKCRVHRFLFFIVNLSILIVLISGWFQIHIEALSVYSVWNPCDDSGQAVHVRFGCVKTQKPLIIADLQVYGAIHKLTQCSHEGKQVHGFTPGAGANCCNAA
jgi:hypothetical protein